MNHAFKTHQLSEYFLASKVCIQQNVFTSLKNLEISKKFLKIRSLEIKNCKNH